MFPAVWRPCPSHGSRTLIKGRGANFNTKVPGLDLSGVTMLALGFDNLLLPLGERFGDCVF